jgi:hypothetical protein
MGDFGAMKGPSLILAATALAAVVALMPSSSDAAGLGPKVRLFGVEGAVERVSFHRPRAISMYCYPRKYWWFYRPYTTAADGHARCMPYFKYPRSGAGGSGGIK